MNDLISLAASINEQHRLAEQAARTAIDHALKVGELLLQVKQQLPHGEFTPWVKASCEFSDRSARGYMRLAVELPKLEESKRQRVAVLPLRDALAAIRKEQPKPEPEPEADCEPEPQESGSFDKIMHQLLREWTAEVSEIYRDDYADLLQRLEDAIEYAEEHLPEDEAEEMLRIRDEGI